jgi:hypothetical protein
MMPAMAFDFEAAVTAPFRMQPGLRRLAPGSPQLTPLAPGSRHQREKLAVLSAFWPQALCAVDGFDATAALDALCRHAAAEQAQAWSWRAGTALACALDTAVLADGTVEQTGRGRFGLGDEIARCLRGLPAAWRRAALLSLAFAEDFALVDGRSGRIPWLAVALPSHWAPEAKVGRSFAEVHAPVADMALVLQAGASLMRLVSQGPPWERFVWTVTDHPRLHAHPDRVDRGRWQRTAIAEAWWRSEHQTFIPLAGLDAAIFTIHVEVQPLAQVMASPARAAALEAAIASMSPAVLEYRGLSTVREALLAWLQARR